MSAKPDMNQKRTYGLIRVRHQLLDQSFLHTLLTLSADHVPAGFVKCMDLLWSKVTGDLAHCTNNFVNERLVLAGLQSNEVATALVGYFDEGVTSHILDPYWLVRSRQSCGRGS